VAEIVYFIDKGNYSNDTAYVASRKLLSMAGVKVNSMLSFRVVSSIMK
jgi:hypothetical protein